MNQLLIKNLRIVKADKELSVNELASIMQVSPAVIKNYLAGKTPIPLKKLNLLSEHVSIPVEDLLGKKLVTQSMVNEPAADYGSPNRIPYYDVDMMASPIEVFNDQTIAPTFYIDIPGFRDCDFAINVYGDSMSPTYENGCMALCKKIKNTTSILYGECYLIVTEDYRVIKRLKKSRSGYVLAVSDNDNEVYQPIEFSQKSILHLYLVKGSIRRHQL